MTRTQLVLLCALVTVATTAHQSLADSDADVLCSKLAASPGDTKLLTQLKAQVSTTSAVDEKARLASIYCLGCMYTRQTQEAESVAAYLRKNFPSNPNTSWLTDGSLRAPCEKCAGDGKVTNPCTSCSGSGECRTCRGQGSRDVPTFSGSEYRRCTVCSGTGKCKQCNGTRKTTAICPACRGQGGILSTERVKVTYLELLARKTPSSASVATLRKSAPLLPKQSATMDPYLRERLLERQKEFEEALKETEKPGGHVSLYDQLIRNLKSDMSDDFGGLPASIDGRTEYWDNPKANVKDKTGWQEFVRHSQQLLEQTHKAEAERTLAERKRQEERQKVAQATATAHDQAEKQAEQQRQDYWDKFLAQTKTMKRQVADFKKAVFDPDKYKGKVLVSKVQIVIASPQAVVVHSLGLGEDQILSCSMSGFDKALRALRVVGEHGVVTIEYVFADPVDGIDMVMPGMPCMRFLDITIE